MHRSTIIVVSDHREIFDRTQAALAADFEILSLHPHAESVVAAAGALNPQAVIVDLSGRSVRCGMMVARLFEELPDARLVLLMEREANPDVKRREWLEKGLERDLLDPGLAGALDIAFAGRLRAVHVESKDRRPAAGPIPETAYSPTFNC